MTRLGRAGAAQNGNNSDQFALRELKSRSEHLMYTIAYILSMKEKLLIYGVVSFTVLLIFARKPYIAFLIFALGLAVWFGQIDPSAFVSKSRWDIHITSPDLIEPALTALSGAIAVFWLILID